MRLGSKDVLQINPNYSSKKIAKWSGVEVDATVYQCATEFRDERIVERFEFG
jgi:hypothetical protein